MIDFIISFGLFVIGLVGIYIACLVIIPLMMAGVVAVYRGCVAVLVFPGTYVVLLLYLFIGVLLR